MWVYCWQEKTLCYSRTALSSQQSFIDFCKLITHYFQEYSDGWWCGLVLLLWWNSVRKMLGVTLPSAQGTWAITSRWDVLNQLTVVGCELWPSLCTAQASEALSPLCLSPAKPYSFSIWHFIPFFEKCIHIASLAYLGRFNHNLFTGQEESSMEKIERQVKEGKCSL